MEAVKAMDKRHVYICGAKGLSQYGGFESFVLNLLDAHKDLSEIKYHVTCKANGQGCMDVNKLNGASSIVNDVFTYNNADCHLVKIPDNIGSAQAIVYDIKSLALICKHIKENNIQNPIVYILACRIGPFVKKYIRKIHKYGGKVLLNPDGHEWKRRKWSKSVRLYWKLSEALMVKHADRIICDSREIEKYILSEYKKYNPSTTYISYGADVTPSKIQDNDYQIINWYEKYGVSPNEYYLVVGRFVQENNFDIIIKEFMKSDTKRKLVLLTTENESLKTQLSSELGYEKDERIVFADSIYDIELVKKIRENAYAYIHGHEVGGTNPSLLEALASTKINIVLGVNFNREVAGDVAIYWEKKNMNLKNVINIVDILSVNKISELSEMSKNRVAKKYNWCEIAKSYFKVFMEL